MESSYTLESGLSAAIANNPAFLLNAQTRGGSVTETDNPGPGMYLITLATPTMTVREIKFIILADVTHWCVPNDNDNLSATPEHLARNALSHQTQSTNRSAWGVTGLPAT